MLTHNEVWKRYLRAYNLPLLLLLLAALVQVLRWNGYLQYDRAAIPAGQLWRLWSAHITHLGWSHFWLNAAGLVLIWLLFRQELSLKAWWGHLLFAGLGVSAGLWWFSPDVIWYVGLSGVLHALFVIGLLSGIRSQPGFTLLVLLVFLGKILLEQFYGPLPGSQQASGGPVVVDAHLYGAIAGAISYAIQYGVQKLKTSLSQSTRGTQS